MYNGTNKFPAIINKPPASQVQTVPIAHGLCIVPFGGINGPRMIATDCTMSEIDKPKINL